MWMIICFTSFIIMKYFYLWIILLFLSSCFGFFEEDETSASLILNDNEEFSILVPNTWWEISNNDLPVPKSWETVLALKSQWEREWYYNNLVILKAENTWDTNSLSLMQSTESMLRNSLDEFKLTAKNNFTFPDEDVWVMLVFSWKYNSNTPTTQYIQTAKICDDTSYFMTISVWEILESYARYEEILQTFRCN